MIIHKALYLRNHVDRWHIKKKEGSGLTNIQDCVDATIQGLDECTKHSKVRLITTAEITQG